MFSFFADKLTQSDAVTICDELARFLVREKIPASEFAVSHERLLPAVLKHLGYDDYVTTVEQTFAIFEQTVHWAYQHSENLQEKISYWAEKKRAAAEQKEREIMEHGYYLSDDIHYSYTAEHKEFLSQLNNYMTDQIYLDRQKWKKPR